MPQLRTSEDTRTYFSCHRKGSSSLYSILNVAADALVLRLDVRAMQRMLARLGWRTVPGRRVHEHLHPVERNWR